VADPPAHRLHVHPWLRWIGRIFLRDWLAITLGRHILAWRAMTASELEHELEHVRQWRRYGLAFPAIYLLDSLRQARAGRRWYRDNRFEVAARQAAARVTPR
jgi:hypothetical protein